MAESASPRVFVVEDEGDCLETMLLLLGLRGCEVRGAKSGVEALAVIADWRPHLVLIDLGLPGMDGCEVSRRLRGLDCNPRPTIAAVTGWHSDEVRERAAKSGIDVFLVKPVPWEQLSGLIDDARVAASAGH